MKILAVSFSNFQCFIYEQVLEELQEGGEVFVLIPFPFVLKVTAGKDRLTAGKDWRTAGKTADSRE